MFKKEEGLVPYCKNCQEYRFPRFATAVSMVVTNRTKDKILLAKHNNQDYYKLIAGYIKRGETAEKAVTREFKEETKLDTVKYKYIGSRYHEPKNILMLGYILVAEDGTLVPDESELESVKWFTLDEALAAIQKDSTAEAFLKSALAEIKKL
jgi:NAD+ diphosphatase